MKNLVELITLASIGFGVSLAVKLMLLKRHGMVVMWLSFYVILLVASLCEIFLPEGSIPGTIVGAGYWLLGPCLYLYVSNRLLQGSIRLRSIILHLTPFAVYTVTVLLSFAFDLNDESGLVDVLLYELVFLHILIYLIAALTLILKTKKINPVRDQSRAMQLASMQVIAILSIALFAISWTSTNIIAFAALHPDTGNYHLLIQGAVTLLIFSIALLNTETRYAESFD
jgi:hypothetical protein